MITLASPAKVNLFLHVLRRRSDGYHELASLFQAVNLCDFLHVSLSESDELHCNDPCIPTDRNNLIWKAIDLYRQKTGKQFSVTIRLDKQIPSEAGLGGGSSNAATALWAVNTLCKGNVSIAELQLWAAEIGSDVPFFFSSGTAYCTSRGEQVRSLKPLSSQDLWIFKPNVGLPTPAVYRQLKVESIPKRVPEECLQRFIDGVTCYFNDLEAPAQELMPFLREFKEYLFTLGFSQVLLSGSGTSFVCIGKPTVTLPSDLKFFHRPASFINRNLVEWFEIEKPAIVLISSNDYPERNAPDAVDSDEGIALAMAEEIDGADRAFCSAETRTKLE